jgi:hypothetical protein
MQSCSDCNVASRRAEKSRKDRRLLARFAAAEDWQRAQNGGVISSERLRWIRLLSTTSAAQEASNSRRNTRCGNGNNTVTSRISTGEHDRISIRRVQWTSGVASTYVADHRSSYVESESSGKAFSQTQRKQKTLRDPPPLQTSPLYQQIYGTAGLVTSKRVGSSNSGGAGMGRARHSRSSSCEEDSYYDSRMSERPAPDSTLAEIAISEGLVSDSVLVEHINTGHRNSHPAWDRHLQVSSVAELLERLPPLHPLPTTAFQQYYVCSDIYLHL